MQIPGPNPESEIHGFVGVVPKNLCLDSFLVNLGNYIQDYCSLGNSDAQGMVSPATVASLKELVGNSVTWAHPRPMDSGSAL